MRKIMFFTGTRAEYGLLRTLIFEVQKKEHINVSLLISGTHVEAKHGNSIEEIYADGLSTEIVVPLELTDKKNVPYSVDILHNMGTAIQEFGKVIFEIKPNLIVILGDRYEAFCCASVATILNIPIAHLHGGEQTQALVDEAFRHSITKMSHIHFTSCEEHRQRVIQLGESPKMVWNTGALGVENTLSLDLLGEEEIRADLGIPSSQPYFLCTFHPVTLELGQEVAQWQEVQKALNAFPEHAIIVTGANADPGGNAINAQLATWAQENPQRIRFFASLGVLRYLSAAKYADCVVGNSSSGIIEIPSLKTPVVNIGNRQQGRICSKAILHCQTEASIIQETIRKIWNLEYKKLVDTANNPYEGERVAEKMAQILAQIPLDGLIQKKFYDIPR